MRTVSHLTKQENVADPSARAAVASHQLWYHTMELAPGLVTPGWFDLRPIVDRLPWPDVRGRRCLDVGPWDGFLAFELERRGAGEVVAADIDDHAEWDWPVATRELGPEVLARMAGEDPPGAGFRIARRILGSSVRREQISVYDLSPERVGRFDVVVCGSLLLHLRDPVRALEAMRSVCDGELLSAETIDLPLTVLRPRLPLSAVKGGNLGQWWVPNVAGHRRLVEAGGFEIERATRPYVIPYGAGHRRPGRKLRALPRHALAWLVSRRWGAPHAAVLARPR